METTIRGREDNRVRTCNPSRGDGDFIYSRKITSLMNVNEEAACVVKTRWDISPSLSLFFYYCFNFAVSTETVRVLGVSVCLSNRAFHFAVASWGSSRGG